MTVFNYVCVRQRMGKRVSDIEGMPKVRGLEALLKSLICLLEHQNNCLRVLP